MNQKQIKAAKADMKVSGVDPKHHDMLIKKLRELWKDLSSKERGALSARWKRA